MHGDEICFEDVKKKGTESAVKRRRRSKKNSKSYQKIKTFASIIILNTCLDVYTYSELARDKRKGMYKDECYQIGGMTMNLKMND